MGRVGFEGSHSSQRRDEWGTGNLAWIFVWMMLILPLRGQMLAHKGWAGNGLTVDAWWKSAVFYRVDASGVEGLTQRLDYLQGLGVDAVVLSPPRVQAGESLEEFDTLEQEASRRKIRVVVEVPVSAEVSVEGTVSAARFWLSRGVGGMRLTAAQGGVALTRADWAARASAVRKLCAGFAGERVVISEGPLPEAVARRRRTRGGTVGSDVGAQLGVDSGLMQARVWDADVVRSVLAGGVPGRVLESDAPGVARSGERFQGGAAVAKMVATVLFAGREEPMIFSGQETGADDGDDADSLLDWYRRMSALRHEQASLREGTLAMVETGYPEVVAWVRRSDAGRGRTVLVVCNVSGQARVISLVEALRKMGVSAGNGVHPLAVSVAGMEASYTAGGISLPAYGVYVGELRQPGLESGDVAVPVRRHK